MVIYRALRGAIICLALIALFVSQSGTAGAGTGTLNEPVSVELRDVLPYLVNSVKANPKDAGLRLALGVLYINIGEGDTRRFTEVGYDPPEFQRAERELKKAIELNPKLYLAHYNLGLLEIHRQDLKKAEKHFVDAIAISAKDVRIHQKLHTIYLLTHQYRMGIDMLEASVKILPREADLYHRLAITYLMIGEFSRSQDNAKKALELRYDPETLNLLATTKIWTNDLRGAERDFRKVLRDLPDNTSAMLGLSRVEIKRGNKTQAMKWLKRVLELDPDNAEALDSIKKL